MQARAIKRIGFLATLTAPLPLPRPLERDGGLVYQTRT
jgi:hypothetical protein